MPLRRPPHVRRRFHHGADDLVIASTAAEIARQPIAHLFFARVWVAFQQRLRRDQNARRADAALQGGHLDEFLLQWVQLIARRHALDGGNVAALSLGPQHQAGTDQTAIHGHRTGAAVAGAAAFLGAREAKPVSSPLIRVVTCSWLMPSLLSRAWPRSPPRAGPERPPHACGNQSCRACHLSGWPPPNRPPPDH